MQRGVLAYGAATVSCDAATPCDGGRNCWEATQSPAKAANGSGPPRKTPRTFLYVRFLLLFRNSFEYSGLGLTWYDLGKHHALQHLPAAFSSF